MPFKMISYHNSMTSSEPVSSKSQNRLLFVAQTFATPTCTKRCKPEHELFFFVFFRNHLQLSDCQPETTKLKGWAQDNLLCIFDEIQTYQFACYNCQILGWRFPNNKLCLVLQTGTCQQQVLHSQTDRKLRKLRKPLWWLRGVRFDAPKRKESRGEGLRNLNVRQFLPLPKS